MKSKTRDLINTVLWLTCAMAIVLFFQPGGVFGQTPQSPNLGGPTYI